jgi:hypothetical protein
MMEEYLWNYKREVYHRHSPPLEMKLGSTVITGKE